MHFLCFLPVYSLVGQQCINQYNNISLHPVVIILSTSLFYPQLSETVRFKDILET